MRISDVSSDVCSADLNAWLPDFVVGVGRGGLAPAVFISHGLSVPMLSVDHSTKLAGFADELLAKLAGLAREGRKLLFVDDINDSGSTVTYIREMLAKQGAVAENVWFAVLINNICSRARVDYWSREIDRKNRKSTRLNSSH